MTSDFRPEMEIRPFCTCTKKNMQCNPYLWPSRRNIRVLNRVEEHVGDVRF